MEVWRGQDWGTVIENKRKEEKDHLHLADSLVDVRICRQRRYLRARQLCHAHLALLGGLLCPRKRDLLLGGDGLRFDLTQKLFQPNPGTVSPRFWNGGKRELGTRREGAARLSVGRPPFGEPRWRWT